MVQQPAPQDAAPYGGLPQDQLLLAMLESSENAITAIAPDGTIRTWNQGAADMYGYSAADIIGHPISVLFPGPGKRDRRYPRKDSRGRDHYAPRDRAAAQERRYLPRFAVNFSHPRLWRRDSRINLKEVDLGAEGCPGVIRAGSRSG